MVEKYIQPKTLSGSGVVNWLGGFRSVAIPLSPSLEDKPWLCFLIVVLGLIFMKFA